MLTVRCCPDAVVGQQRPRYFVDAGREAAREFLDEVEQRAGPDGI